MLHPRQSLRNLSIFFVLAILACGSPIPPTPTPLPTATPTPTLEQKRALIISYLRDYNRIGNDLDQVSQSIQLPASSAIYTINQLYEVDRMLEQQATATRGAVARYDALVIPDLDEVFDHLKLTTRALRNRVSVLERTRQAVASGSQAIASQLVAEALVQWGRESSVNRSTEDLMLKYNITDSDVNYRFRGK